MKKILSLLMAGTMIFSSMALAEEVGGGAVTPPEYDSLTVGVTTPFNGQFATDLWGNNATDIDIRFLLHGYNLMNWDSESGTYAINPTVVSGVSAAQDQQGNRTYLVALAHDLTYSNGAPVTAWDYAFSILLSACPEAAEIGGNVSTLDYITGVPAYRSGKAETISGVRVLNDYLFSVTVSAEYLPFFYELAVLNILPYPAAIIAPGCVMTDAGNGIAIINADPEVKEPVFTAELLKETLLDPETGYVYAPSVVTGPYTLESVDAAAETAVFRANPYFKGDKDGYVPAIHNLTVTYVPGKDAVNGLTNGSIGLANHIVNADDITAGLELTGEPAYAFSNYLRTGFSFISFNCEKETVAEAAVRQAIAQCFDKQAFIDELVSNYGMSVEGYYGIGQWMYQMVNGTLVPETEEEMDDETKAAWEELTMEAVPVYTLDTDAAAALLQKNGWTIGESGLREKEINGEKVVLDLKLLIVENSTAAAVLEDTLVANLEKIGIKLTIEQAAGTEMLSKYYRAEERDNDMFYMASNFGIVFDPAPAFTMDESTQIYTNRNAIADEKLYQLAADLNATEPGDTLGYCQKWLAFETRYAEVLPSIPVYSNVYFDFYNAMLHDYDVTASQSWAQAIVRCYLSDYEDEPAAEEDGEEETFN